MKHTQASDVRERAAAILGSAGIVITPEEKAGMEVADCGFGKTLRPCRHDVVLFEGLEHGIAHHQHSSCIRNQRPDSNWQDDVLEHISR